MPLSRSSAVLCVALVASLGASGCAEARAAAPPARSAPPPSLTTGSPPPATAAPPPSHARAPDSDSIYRFDFVVTSNEGKPHAEESTFSMTLRENYAGEMNVGRNIPLSVSPPPPAPATAGALGGKGPAPAAPVGVGVARQDVGTKIKAMYKTSPDGLILEVTLEMSLANSSQVASGPITIRRITASSFALVPPGKPVVVSSSEVDQARCRMTVTATRVR